MKDAAASIRPRTLKPRFDKKILCLFTADQAEAIYQRAKAEGKGKTEIIRDSVEQYLFGGSARYNPDAKP